MPDTTVYFATNRKPNNDANPTDFTEEITGDADSIRFGSATLSGDELFKQDVVALAGNVRIDVAPEQLHPTNANLATLGSTKVFGDIATTMRTGDFDALFFIHGYNYTFRQSVARAVQLKQWLTDRPVTLLMFAWPSLGQGVAPQTYKDDRVRAEVSGKAIARAILKAADFIRATRREERCNQRIHLISHSMGAWALRGAIQGMRTFVGDNIPPVFNEVMITAGDEDHDALALNYKLMPILRGCQRLTVYYNVQDLALKASDVAMGNPDRLGRAGPDGRASLPEKVVPVNVSAAIHWKPDLGLQDWEVDDTGHQYYRNNKVVRDDLIQILKGVSTGDIQGRIKRDDYWRVG